MTDIVIAMLVCVGVGALVLALVAVPRLRSGDRVLTHGGREAVDDAARRARAMAQRAQRAEADRAAAPSARHEVVDLRDESATTRRA